MLASRLVLASSSPRRRELLTQAGYDFVIDPADIDETMSKQERALEATTRLALEKAATVLARCGSEAVVLAADTTVVVGEQILGKPAGPEQAAQMLMSLSGRNHHVLTAWAVLHAGGGESGVSRSTVRMREVGWQEARAYAASGEPLDKAGAYAAQGQGRRFIGAIIGPLDNVIGLPMAPVSRALARARISPTS
ncbi:MAG TPA: Maf family protein [Candidatus Limnocylindrales bacterium]|nr:Maf family protein [Candidatus Limnocylindrales bacterium]